MTKALIFDFDGTLVDSMPMHWQAWQAVMPRYHIQFSEERFYSLGGVPSTEILAMLRVEQGLDLDPVAVAREKELAYMDLLAHIEPIEAIMDIARSHAGQLPLAIASGGRRRVIEAVLHSLNIADLFSALVTSEDVVRHKPAPDVFLEAARRLKVPPHLCRAYEDTDLGLQAIRAAGMEAVDVRELLSRVEI